MGDDEGITANLLNEMAAFYRARAPEYDAWFARRKQRDDGPAENDLWFAEVGTVFAALDDLAMDGHILELAAGSGIWTERLLRTAAKVTAVDVAPEMMALNRARNGDDRVRYILADLFAWHPDQTYDGVCCAFWLSHVPRERLDARLRMVTAALKPGGKVFFVDSKRQQAVSELASQVVERRLNDGRTFRIVKNFHEPGNLVARCAAVGLEIGVQETASIFMFGTGSRRG